MKKFYSFSSGLVRVFLASGFLFSILFPGTSKAQPSCFWANKTGAIDYDYGRSIATDPNGYVYVAGHFYGTGDFGGTTLSTLGGFDVFLSKFDTSGVLIWEKQIGGKGNDYVNKIFLDNAGNVYLAGSFSDTVDFNPDTAVIKNRYSKGELDAFIAKYDSSGNYIWSKTVGGTEDDFGNSAGFDNNNFVFLAGTFSGTSDFYPGSGVNNLTSAGGTDIFLVVLDTAGTYYTSASAGGTGDDDCRSIAVIPYSGIYLTGGFSGTANLNPVGTYNLTSSGGTDIFLVRMAYSDALYFSSARKIGGSGNDKGLDISLDVNGYEYITGYFEDTVDFNPSSPIYNLISNGGTDIFVCRFFYGTNFSWGASMGGDGNDYGYSVVVDGSFNVFSTGSFSGTADFDPDANTYYLASQGLEDIFISKLDQVGNFSWAKQIGGISSDEGRSIALDASGNIFTTGYFSNFSPGNTVDFDPGSGSAYLSSSGSSDVFIQHLDASGNYLWANKMGSGSANASNCLGIDASGNVFTAGYFYGTADFDPGPGIYNISTTGLNDIFISKTDPSGNFVWTKQIGSDGLDIANALVIDSTGNIYVTGYFSNTVDFDPGTGTYNLVSAGSYDIFVLKLDSAGNFIWAKQIGGISNDVAYSLFLTNGGDLLFTGYFFGTSDFDPGAGVSNLTPAGSGDIFICKLDNSGNFLWAKQMGGTGNENANKIFVDNAGNIYTTGYFSGDNDFDPGPGIYSVPWAGSNDIFISKLDSSGNFIWAKGMGGLDADVGFSIAVDEDGNVYAGGNFNGTADLDPGIGTHNLTSVAGTDLYLLKLDSAGNFIRVVQIGSSGSENVNAISLDGKGGVFFSGNYGAPEADFDPGPGVFNMDHKGKPDVYFCNYDTAFNFLWAMGLGSEDLEMCTSFLMDTLGNFYATGRFRATSDLQPGNGTFYLTADGMDDMFTIKFHPVVFNTSSLPVSCFGGNDGNATASPIQGVSPFTYTWSDGEPTQTATALSGGNQYVTVTDDEGCIQISDSVDISQPAEILSTISIVSGINCSDGNDGIVSVACSGGTGSFQYDWSNGDTLISADSLISGTLFITVTDSNSCTKTDSIQISQPTAVSTVISSTPVSCTGGTNGTATVNVSGGTTPYTFLWNTSPAQTTQTANTLKGQTYLVTVTDGNGCTKIDSVSLINPPLLTSSMTKTKVNCFGGGDGTATVNPTGGTSPYTYYWNIGQTGQTATGLYPGNYAVNVLDAMGCSTNNIVSIGQPMQPSLSVFGINVSCNGDSTGMATANPSGGTTPYSYIWSTTATSKTITGLAAGTYYVTVSDSCNISGTDSIVITQPASLSSQINSQNVKCFGYDNGLATANASGGNSPYSYSWSSGSSQPFTNNLSPGVYYVSITDACTKTIIDSVTIVEPGQLVATDISHTDILCNGGGDGTATVNPAGGTTPYTYNWSTGLTGQTAVGLFPGTFGVNVFDSKGCLASNTVTITQPSPLGATTSVSYVSCNAGSDGSVDVTVSGGTSPFIFNWSNNDTTEDVSGLSAGAYTVTITDSCGASLTQTVQITQPGNLSLSSVANNVKCNGQNNGSASVSVSGGVSPYTYAWSNNAATANISLLGPNTYYVTVSDFCSQAIIDSVFITEPIALSTSLSKTDVNCYGLGDGTATVTPSGGSSPFTYFWNNNQTMVTAVGLFPGTYSVNVVDVNGCLASGLVIISQPNQLSATSSFTNVSCNSGSNGTAAVTVAGGSTPYSYLWNDPAATATATATSLSAGTFSVTVTDSCSATVVQTVQIAEPGILSTSVLKSDVSCNGGTNGSASVIVTGGVSPFSYSWSNNGTTSQITGLTTQVYYVTTTDFCGQTAIDSVMITEPSLLTSSVTKTDITCHDFGNGTATVSATGGTTPYTYQWNNGQNQATAVGLFAGNYSVNVFDANFCIASNVITITQPAALSLNISSTSATCGNADASATATVSGGTPSYSYLWSNGDTTANASALTNGNNSVTVMDNNNCSISANINIGVAAVPQEICLVTVDISNTKNLIVWEKPVVSNIDSFRIYRDIVGTYTKIGTVAYDDLSKFVDITNGVNPNITSYRYKITALDTCGNESPFSAYHKTMHLTKSIGTQGEVNLIWDGYQGFSSNFYYRILKDSVGNGNFIAIDSVSNNNFTYTATPPTVNTQYLIEVVHPGGGCTATKAAENHNSSRSNKHTAAPPGSAFSASTETFPASAGNCDGTATVIATGGVTPYTYQWDGNTGSQTTATATGLCVGVYFVTVTDATGATTMVSATVDIMPGTSDLRLPASGFRIYPNPNDGTFTIELNNSITQSLNNSITIYNMLGEIIYQSLMTIDLMTIDLSKHGSGMYYLQVQTEHGNSTPVKLVVH